MAKKRNTTAKRHINKSKAIDYDYHLPVLLEKSVDLLITNPDGMYLDGTLGGGGHSAEILRRLGEGGKLLAFDKDDEAIAHCTKKFWGELAKGDNSRIVLHNMPFEKACSIKEVNGNAQGVLLDLGVSSRQLDTSHRGFSYRMDTSLDMRFVPDGTTAQEIINSARQEEIERILLHYGEEPFARVIARRIVEKRRAFPINTTFALRSIVEESVPSKLVYNSLSRVFQAFRIAVNRELDVLQEALENFFQALAPEGRIVVISYHSLEDRIVKQFFKEHSQKSHLSKYKTEEKTANSMPKLRILTTKPILPTESEIETNPRSRSAKIRAAEKEKN